MIVHRLIDRDDILANFQVLADWVEANGVDPHRVAPDWLAVIETADGRRYLYFLEKYRTPAGSDLIDPANPDRAWTYERSVPLTVEVPTLAQPEWRAGR